MNPTVIIGLAMVLLLAFKQYGIELFSIKNKVAAIARLFFSAAFALTLSIGRQIQFQYVSANYTKTTIADGSYFLLSCLFLHFCVFFFIFTIDLFINAKTGNIFYCSKHTGFLFKKIFFILYCLFSSVLASLSVGIVSWSGFA
ncbi:hypothetical protein ACWPXT_00480 [Enterococcus faecium]